MIKIKRPLVGTAVVFIAADACAIADSMILTLTVAMTIIVGLLLGVYFKHFKIFCLILFIFFIMAYCFTKNKLEPNPISAFMTSQTEGISVEITGVVDKIQTKETFTQIYLKNTQVVLPQGNMSASGIIVNVSEYSCGIGDTVRVKGKLKEFPVDRNTGGFNSRFYYRTIGIEYRCTGKITEIISKNENELLKLIETFKLKLKKSYDSISNEKDAGLYESIIIGDKEGLTEDINDLYKNNGIAHLLAISGMHISIIGLTLYMLLRKVGIHFLSCAVSSIAVILCYGIMTGNGVSTMRALIMFVIMAFAGVAGRTYDMLTATALAAILILMDSPTMLLNCAFLLSFGAIIGMVVTAPCVNDLIYMFAGDWLKDDLKIKAKAKRKDSLKRSAKDGSKVSSKVSSKDGSNGLLKDGSIGKMNDKAKEVIDRVFSISTICPISSICNKILKYVVLSASMSFSVSLTTLPIILYFYFQVPVYSVIVNIIVVPLMTLVMLSAAAGGLFGIISPAFGMFFIGMAHYILAFFESVCVFFSKLPYSLIIVGKPSVGKIILFYVMLMGFVGYMTFVKKKSECNVKDRKESSQNSQNSQNFPSSQNSQTPINLKIPKDIKKVKKIEKVARQKYILIAFILPVMILMICYSKNENLEITMIDVGQGDSIFVRTPDNETYLFDGGSSDMKNAGKYVIVPFLKAKGTEELDYAIISHMDADHMNGIKEILEEENCFGLKINNVVLPDIGGKDEDFLAFEKIIRQKGISIIYAGVGDMIGENINTKISHSDGTDSKVVLKCLYPSKGGVYSSTNGYSMTVSLNYKSFDMLFTGDLETEGENSMRGKNQLKDYDVLKVAHHGSMYSTQEKFLAVVRPEIALISCGAANSFGHPHKELISRLENIKSKIFITSECGEISITTDGSSVALRRYIEEKKKE